MSPAFASFVAVLTILGWGGGELIGHGVNRYLNRRYVKRWLEAEAHWKRAERSRRVEAGKPKRGPAPKREWERAIRENPNVAAAMLEKMKQLEGDWLRNRTVVARRIDTLTGDYVEMVEVRSSGRTGET